MRPVRCCLFLWCHGKVQGLFAIWYTWQCWDSINILFTAIYSSRGNHHGLWRTIIHGWGPFSFPRWVCVYLCLCVLNHQKGCFITQVLHEIITPFWQWHSREWLFHSAVEQILFCTHPLFEFNYACLCSLTFTWMHSKHAYTQWYIQHKDTSF